jgi:site-specific DNA recombinase
MTSTVIYVRQSIYLPEGIDRQLVRSRALAAQRGWRVAGEYLDNDTSATKPRGPASAWSRMLSDASTGAFTHVIAVDLDRLLRSQRDLLTLLDSGLKVVTVDGELDLSTADGEFRASIMASVARFEVRRKTERARRAGDHRAALGIPQSGKRPYGYNADLVTLYEPEARWIRYITNRLDEGASVNAVTRELLALGCRTALGNEWSTNTVKKVALRPRNAGLMMRYGEVVGPSIIEPAVPVEQWQRVRDSFSLHSPIMGVGAPESWLSLLILCGACGRPMRRTSQKSGRIIPGVKTRTYRCVQAFDRIHQDDRIHCTIAAHLVEEAVDKYCQAIPLTEESLAAGRFLTWPNLTTDEKRSVVRKTLCVWVELGGRGAGRVNVVPIAIADFA